MSPCRSWLDLCTMQDKHIRDWCNDRLVKHELIFCCDTTLFQSLMGSNSDLVFLNDAINSFFPIYSHAVSRTPTCNCVKGFLEMAFLSVFDLFCYCDLINLLVYPHSIFCFYFVYVHFKAQRTKPRTLWNCIFHSQPRWHFVSNFDPLLFLM